MRMLLLAAMLFIVPPWAARAEPGDTFVPAASFERRLAASPPVRWAKDWTSKVEESAPFSPVKDAVKIDAKEFLPKSPLPDEEQKAREKTFEDIIAALNQPHPQRVNDPFFPLIHESSRVGPSIIASPAVGLGIVAVGAVGWIGLGTGVLLLGRRARSAAGLLDAPATDGATHQR